MIEDGEEARGGVEAGEPVRGRWIGVRVVRELAS